MCVCRSSSASLTGRPQTSINKTVDPVDCARSAQCNQLNLLRVSRLETHCGACRNVQPHTVGRLPVEIESTVHLKKMAVRTNLNGPIASIRHSNTGHSAAGIGVQRLALEKVFSRNHLYRIGWWTVTSFVPSGKVPST